MIFLLIIGIALLFCFAELGGCIIVLVGLALLLSMCSDVTVSALNGSNHLFGDHSRDIVTAREKDQAVRHSLDFNYDLSTEGAMNHLRVTVNNNSNYPVRDFNFTCSWEDEGGHEMAVFHSNDDSLNADDSVAPHTSRIMHMHEGYNDRSRMGITREQECKITAINTDN